jgi:MFS family permease
MITAAGSWSANRTDPAGRLPLVIASNGVLRVAGGASSVLVGVYLAVLASQGMNVGAGLAGTLAAISFGAELLGAVPLGLLSDVMPVRTVMTGGALLAAVATVVFGMTHNVGVFVLSRALEGVAAAAGVPSLLAYLTDVTATDAALRARAMSYFELSLLAGLALGGIVAGQLWAALRTGAFTALALMYVVAAVLFSVGSIGGQRHHPAELWGGLIRSLAMPQLRRLAPVWACMNAILGLWLGPTLYFLLTHRSDGSQLLAGLFVDNPSGLGWLLFAYTLVFGAGVVIWSRVLPRMDVGRALRISLVAMLAVTIGLLLLNHMNGYPAPERWLLIAAIAALIMVESGFTPAALSLLAGAVGSGRGRGAAMGIYSFLLSLGALVGSVIAAVAGRWLVIDGLTLATLGLAVVALGLLPRLDSVRPALAEARE